jgi:hypothetical protein
MGFLLDEASEDCGTGTAPAQVNQRVVAAVCYRCEHPAFGRIDAGQSAMSGFWDVVVLLASTFVFVAYVVVLFHIVVDLFRDSEVGGGIKALWIIGLVFLPVLTSIVYILARGGGMAARQQASMKKAKDDADTYIRTVAGTSPAQEIAQAKALLDAGTINADEYGRLKAKALG